MFNELSLRDEFVDYIQNYFNEKKDEIRSDFYVYKTNKQATTFPCCTVKILSPVSANGYGDSDGEYNKVAFSVEFNLYTKGHADFSAEDSLSILSSYLLSGITSKYSPLKVSANAEIPYKTNTKRKNIVLYGIYDVLDNIIYSN
jgi:hypothetical protein